MQNMECDAGGTERLLVVQVLPSLITQTKFGVKWEVRYWREVDSDRPEECTNGLDTGYSFSNSFPTMVVILMKKKKGEVPVMM